MAHPQSVIYLLLMLAAAPLHAQQWHTTIDIVHPAELTLPAEVSELLLVNNTVAHPDIPTGAFYTLMAASEMLESSDYLPSVLEVSQNSSGSIYRRQLLTNPQADSLLTTYRSDALLVLNQLIVHPATECYETNRGTFYAYTQGIAATHWTLFYHAGSTDALHARSFICSDTLYWEHEAEDMPEAVQAMPSTAEASSEMCLYAGERIARRLLPTVETADRYLYDLGSDDRGMYFFTRRRWQQAIDAWSQPQSDKKLAAYAAANSAVAYEILGDIRAAYAACDRALTALEGLRSVDARQQVVNIRYYQTTLLRRL